MTQTLPTGSPMPIRVRFTFDPAKAVEVILYIADRVSDAGFHRISKILYFADRKHPAHHGRFICGDSYVAMKHGPVPSGAYDILKFARGDGLSCEVAHAKGAIRVEDGRRVVPLRQANLNLLSEKVREGQELDECFQVA